MGFFTSRKPRGFHHEYIYYDARKEKLKKIEDKAKRELGMLEEKQIDPERIHEAFINSTKHLKRRKESGRKPLSYGLLFVLIAACLFALHYLLTGQWNF